MGARAQTWIRRIGRRGVFLAFLGLLDVVIAYGLRAPLPLGLSHAMVYQPFVLIAPLWVWWGCWLATGILCTVSAVWQRPRPVAFFCAALVKTAWAAGYLTGWWLGMPLYTRGYQSAVIFLAFGGVVLIVSGWRENGT